MCKDNLMRSLERGKAAPRGLVPEARRITDVAAVNDHVAEIRFGKSDFLLIPAPIDYRSAQRWVSCMRRIDAIKFQFSEDGLSARLNGVGRLRRTTRTVPLATALGLLDRGVPGWVSLPEKVH